MTRFEPAASRMSSAWAVCSTTCTCIPGAFGSRNDDITDQGSVLQLDGSEASPAAAGALSRGLVRSMVGVEPSSRPTFASLLEDPYLLQPGAASAQAYSEVAKVPVSWLHGHGDEQGYWGVQMDPAQCQEVRRK